MKNFAVVLLTIALAACASHGVNLSDGTEKPAPDDAVIRVWSPSSGLVRVSAVDGKERGNYTSHVYVRPGDHQLTVTYNSWGGAAFHSKAPAQLNLNTKAAHSYVVNAIPDFENKRVRFEIEDKGTQYDPSCLIPRRFAPSGLEGKNC